MTADNEELDAPKDRMLKLLNVILDKYPQITETYELTELVRSVYSRISDGEANCDNYASACQSWRKRAELAESQLQQVKADAERFQFLYDNWYSHLDRKPLYLWIEANLLRFGGLRNTLDSARRNDGTA